MPTTRAGTTWRFDKSELRTDTRELFVEGRVAKIGARAFDLLVALIERRGRTVAKNELLSTVWPDVVVEENNLQVQVSALRKLLGPQAIATIPGRGYRFVPSLQGGHTAPKDPPRAADAVPIGNLPPRPPALIAREGALRDLEDRIEDGPLVTVVGAAGIGKSALAEAAAHRLGTRWADGVWWVDLSTVEDAARLPHAVAQSLRLVLDLQAQGEPQLLEALRSRSMLLVLDNCEHLVDAVASLAQAILTHAVGVRLLATSQEPLNLPDETVVKLASLRVPRADEVPLEPTTHGAVQLFVTRARAADSRFEWRAELAAPIGDICRRLDGLPLAIELAAARVRLLGVQGVRERLSERFRLLTGGARSAMRRHQTLHAAIEWSHALLSAAEQAVLRRLSLFVGGFTLELAQGLANDKSLDEWQVLDALSGLVDKSLVVADAGDPPRYRLFDSTRVYALERLADAGETQPWIVRHAQAVRDLFVRIEASRNGEGGQMGTDEFVRTLAPELDNLRAALASATADPDQFDLAVQLAGAAAVLLHKMGRVQEGLDVMKPLAQRLESSPGRAAATEGEAVFWAHFSHLGDIGRLPQDVAIRAATRAEAYFRAHGQRRRLYLALYGKGWLLNAIGEHDQAEAVVQEMGVLESPDWPAGVRASRPGLQSAICDVLGRFEESRALLTELEKMLAGAPGEAIQLGTCRTNLALALLQLQRHEEVVQLVHDALRPLGVQLGNTAYLSAHLVTALTCLGRLDEAERAMLDALPAWRRSGLLRQRGHQISLLLAEQGRLEAAVRVNASAAAVCEQSGMADLPAYRWIRGCIERRLAEAGIDAGQVEAWRREGAVLDAAAVEALCRSFDARKEQGPAEAGP